MKEHRDREKEGKAFLEDKVDILFLPFSPIREFSHYFS